MKNSGVMLANDTSKDREKALFYNLQRMGVTNCIFTNYDGRKFPKVTQNFDRVQLEALCTGLGIISKDPSIQTQKNETFSFLYCCKKGGIVVYLTCSVIIICFKQQTCKIN